jgi:spermidine/putrescine transport system ATP-binding protein
MQTELKRIQREVGITFLHVTHDQSEALSMSDRIAVMNHGRIEQLGAPEVLYERPETAFVASFLGSGNLMAADLVAQDGPLATVRLADGSPVRLPRSRLGGRSSMDVGVRPERLRLVAGEAVPPGWNALEGTIAGLSYRGLGTTYRIAVTPGTELTVFEQNTGRALVDRAPGGRVRLGWDPADTYAVEASTASADATDPLEERAGGA